MSYKRVLLIDENVEKALTTICDAALRSSGMHMATLVAQIVDAIHEEPEDELYW